MVPVVRSRESQVGSGVSTGASYIHSPDYRSRGPEAKFMPNGNVLRVVSKLGLLQGVMD